MKHHVIPSACFALLAILLVLLPVRSTWADAEWWDNHFTFRRLVTVAGDAANADPDPIAELRFYSAGHVNPNGDDIRLTTETGTLLPSQTLMVAPGDEVRVAFSLYPHTRRYYVYFGNPNPPPQTQPELKFTGGLLLETRLWSNGQVNNAEQLQQSWDHAHPTIGKTLVDKPFVSGNPFGDQSSTVSKYTGRISAPMEGDYLFAAAANNRGALFIDGRPIVYAPFAPADIRFSGHVTLTPGKHDFVFYQLHSGGDSLLSVGWKRPDMPKVEVIQANAFGTFSHAQPGPLETFGKHLTADFSAEYLGECFVAGNYSYRWRFTAALPAGQQASVGWDFGDGLTAAQPVVEHVFLTDGVYPIRLTIKSGAFEDVQTTKFSISRDYEHLVQPLTDVPIEQSRLVASYDVEKMPPRWPAPALMLHLRADNDPAMIDTLRGIVAERSHGDVGHLLDVMRQVTAKLIAGSQRDAVLQIWQSIPSDSDLQPEAARYTGQLLLWWAGDFAQAEKLLEPFAAKSGDDLKRIYAEALILNQKVEQGRRILLALPVSDDAHRQPAISGAMARTIEYYIDQGDWESGEEAWESWQRRYPATFLEGYSLLLRVRLMELKHAPPSGIARIAEAFAAAVPNSPYSPQLLDRASKLLAASDPARSKQLRQRLKDRYPEDPLSQN